VVTLTQPLHIRPEIKFEVQSYLDLRAQMRAAEDQLRISFAARMSREGLTPAEYAMIDEALERKDR
jgi:hypothetical protein